MWLTLNLNSYGVLKPCKEGKKTFAIMKYLFSRYLLFVALFLTFFVSNLNAQQPTNDSLYIVGSATPGGWSNPIPKANVAAQTFTTISPTDYKISVLLIGGAEYKFISQNGSWTNNWGIGKALDPTEVNGGPFSYNSQNILSPAVTGIYNIEVNFALKIFTVALAATPKVNISSFSPTSAAAGGTVTIKGVGFIGATAVSFGGIAATSFSVINDSIITAVVGKAASGTIQITAPNGVGILGGFTFNTNTLFIVGSATPGGWSNPIPTADSAVQQFTSISATEYTITLPLIGGKEYKFIPQDGSWAVSYGITTADDPKAINGGSLISANSQNILSPAASGTYTIYVNLQTNTFTVTANGVPKVNIASFVPTSAAKDSTVIIHGIGLTGATAVSFGGTAAVSYVVVNDSTVTAVVGTGTSGNVQVVAPNGTASLAGFTFVTPVTPNNTLYIVGSATPGGWANPIPAADSLIQKFTPISATQFTITLPLIGGLEYKFLPTNGSWTTSYGIAIADDPNSVNGGTLITANSQNILSPALTGTYTINVNLQTNTFTVTLVSVAKVTISAFAPTSAAKDSTVTIHGIGFTGATSVSFGGTAAASFVVVNDSTVTAILGTGTSGNVQVVTPNGNAFLAGFTFVAPVTPNNTLYIVGSATPGGWANPIPAADSLIQKFTPISATEFTITLPLIGGLEYKFLPMNGSWTTSYGIAIADDPKSINGGTLISANSQNILSPAASGTYTINVNLQTNTFTVTLVAPATVAISSFAPTTATTDATVTIHGNSFTGATAVGFGGSAATSFVVVNDTTITAVVGSGASGDVMVIAPTGTANLAGFTFVAPILPTMYIIGTATASGWTNPIPDSMAHMFTAISGTEFKITTHLIGGGEYKFIPTNGLWTGSYGISVQDDPTKINGGAIVADGQNILAPSLTGTYTITVNTKTKLFTITLVSPDSLYIVGNATAGGWNNPIPSIDSAAQQFTKIGDAEFKITTWLAGDSAYKFIAQNNGKWDNNWGIGIAKDPAMIYGGALVYGALSQDILAPTASGFYDIDVNFATNSFTVTVSLPVKIASFTAVVNNKLVVTNWATASEENTNVFNLQHSTDGSNFATVGTIKAVGAGANNYQFTDISPANGINYYRLQTVDNNGSYAISKVISVQVAESKSSLSVYPTVVKDGRINIRTNENTAGKAIIKVTDLNGRTLQSGTLSLSAGKYVLPYNLAASVKGIQVVSIETATTKHSFKVVVE